MGGVEPGHGSDEAGEFSHLGVGPAQVRADLDQFDAILTEKDRVGFVGVFPVPDFV